MNNQTFLKLVVASALAFGVVACSDDSNPEPTPTDDGGAAGTGKAGEGGESGTGGKGGTGGDDEDGGMMSDGGGLVDDAAVPDKCIDQTTLCFKTDVCKPVSEEHFLNSCTEAVCKEYDNDALTKLEAGGELPDLP